MEIPNPVQRPSRPRRWRRKLLFAAVVSLVLLELGLRFLLFHDGALAHSWGAGLRDPANFAYRWTDEYWKLRYIFADPDSHRPTRHDGRVGWLHQRIHDGTYDHAARGQVAGRRPVLLYGDSFAACVTSREDCWEGILAESELNPSHELLNYGVGGYGFDQTVLLFQQSIDLWTDQKPVVVISLLVDVNLDRTALHFKGWPKPYLIVGEDGSLTHEEEVVHGSEPYLESHPVGIASYAWRYLVNGSGVLPDAWQAGLQGRGRIDDETRARSRALLETVREECETRDLEYFVLLFHGRRILASEDEDTEDWHDSFLIEELERLEMPYVSSRPLLQEHARQSERPVSDYFFTRGIARRHYTPLANRVVFEAIRRGIARDYD